MNSRKPEAGALLSAIVPFFNEEESLSLLIPALVQQLQATGCGFEIVCIDDG